MNNSLKSRIRALEIRTGPNTPVIAWQSLDDPELYTVIETGQQAGRYGEMDKPRPIMTLAAIEEKYHDREIILVVYETAPLPREEGLA